MSTTTIPILYSVAMGTSGLGALVSGWLFDRIGFAILPPAVLIAAGVTPLVFFGFQDRSASANRLLCLT